MMIVGNAQQRGEHESECVFRHWLFPRCSCVNDRDPFPQSVQIGDVLPCSSVGGGDQPELRRRINHPFRNQHLRGERDKYRFMTGEAAQQRILADFFNFSNFAMFGDPGAGGRIGDFSKRQQSYFL